MNLFKNTNLTNIGTSWDQLAPNEDNAIAFADKYLNAEPKRCDKYGNYSLEYRLAGTSSTINNYLRKGYYLGDMEDFKNLFHNYYCTTNIVLYRGVIESVYNLMVNNALGYSDADLFEKGFLCTSLVKGHECPYKYRLRIKVPAFTHVVYWGDINYEEKKYYEVLVMSGAKLKIISIDDIYINCELLSTD